MNCIKIPVLFGLFLSLFLLNCQSTIAEKSTKEGLKVGDALTYRISTINENRAGAEGQEVTVLMNQEQDYEFIIKELLENGHTRMDFIMKDMMFSASNLLEGVPMGDQIVFDSKVKEKDENPAFGLFQQLVDYPYTMIYDNAGKVLSIKGLETRIDSLYKEVTTPGAQQFMAQMKGTMNEATMKVQLNELTGYSTLGKEIGDSWETLDTVSLIPTTKTHIYRKYTLKERQEGKVTLDVEGTIQVAPNSVVKTAVMKFRYDISGTLEGAIIIDEKNGWVITSTMEQVMSGKMIGSGPGMGGEETLNFYSEMDAKIERL